jgi:hypothetical protein
MSRFAEMFKIGVIMGVALGIGLIAAALVLNSCIA